MKAQTVSQSTIGLIFILSAFANLNQILPKVKPKIDDVGTFFPRYTQTQLKPPMYAYLKTLNETFLASKPSVIGLRNLKHRVKYIIGEAENNRNAIKEVTPASKMPNLDDPFHLKTSVTIIVKNFLAIEIFSSKIKEDAIKLERVSAIIWKMQTKSRSRISMSQGTIKENKILALAKDIQKYSTKVSIMASSFVTRKFKIIKLLNCSLDNMANTTPRVTKMIYNRARMVSYLTYRIKDIYQKFAKKFIKINSEFLNIINQNLKRKYIFVTKVIKDKTSRILNFSNKIKDNAVEIASVTFDYREKNAKVRNNILKNRIEFSDKIFSKQRFETFASIINNNLVPSKVLISKSDKESLVNNYFKKNKSNRERTLIDKLIYIDQSVNENKNKNLNQPLQGNKKKYFSSNTENTKKSGIIYGEINMLNKDSNVNLNNNNNNNNKLGKKSNRNNDLKSDSQLERSKSVTSDSMRYDYFGVKSETTVSPLKSSSGRYQIKIHKIAPHQSPMQYFMKKVNLENTDNKKVTKSINISETIFSENQSDNAVNLGYSTENNIILPHVVKPALSQNNHASLATTNKPQKVANLEKYGPSEVIAFVANKISDKVIEVANMKNISHLFFSIKIINGDSTLVKPNTDHKSNTSMLKNDDSFRSSVERDDLEPIATTKAQVLVHRDDKSMLPIIIHRGRQGSINKAKNVIADILRSKIILPVADNTTQKSHVITNLEVDTFINKAVDTPLSTNKSIGSVDNNQSFDFNSAKNNDMYPKAQPIQSSKHLQISKEQTKRPKTKNSSRIINPNRRHDFLSRMTPGVNKAKRIKLNFKMNNTAKAFTAKRIPWRKKTIPKFSEEDLDLLEYLKQKLHTPSNKAFSKPEYQFDNLAPVRNSVKVMKIHDLYRAGRMICHLELCHQAGRDVILFIFILSFPENIKERKSIRDTWGSFDNRNEVNIAFLVGHSSNSELEHRIRAEDSIYGDVIRAPIIDSEYNQTLKTLSMLDWVKTNCPLAKYILKTHDHTFIHVDNVLRLIRNISVQNYTIFGSTSRNSMNSASLVNSMLKVFPTFLTGHAYLLTNDCVSDLYYETMTREYFKLEDVFFTGLMAERLNIQRRNIEHFLNNYRSLSACEAKKTFVFYNVSSNNQIELYNKMHDKTVVC